MDKTFSITSRVTTSGPTLPASATIATDTPAQPPHSQSTPSGPPPRTSAARSTAPQNPGTLPPRAGGLHLPPTSEKGLTLLAAKRAARQAEELQALQRATPLSKADRQLAPYLLARTVTKRPVGPIELESLRRANETVVQTRDEVFTQGRGNVRPDVEASREQSSKRTKALRDTLKAAAYEDTVTPTSPLSLRDKLKAAVHRDTPTISPLSPADRAGLAALYGAGNCGEHADVAQHLHAARLGPGEKVRRMGDSRRDHAFAVVEARNGMKIVADPWAEGPAVNADDHRYTKPGRLDALKKRPPTTEQTAQADVEAFRHVREVGQALDPVFQRLEAKVTDKASDIWHLWEPEPIIRKSYAADAKKALKTVPTPGERGVYLGNGVQEKVRLGAMKAQALVSSPAKQTLAQMPVLRAHAEVRNAVLAAGTARRMGASVSEAAGVAPQVVDGAKHLRRPDPERVARLNPQGEEG